MEFQFETFDDVYHAAQVTVGVKLFTVSTIADAQTTFARVYTSRPDVYPVAGRKTLDGDTNKVWLQQVVIGQQPFLGVDKNALRSFFIDHATIESLGGGAIINVPVIDAGMTIGSINFVAAEGSYDDHSVKAAVEVARRSVHLVAKANENFS